MFPVSAPIAARECGWSIGALASALVRDDQRLSGDAAAEAEAISEAQQAIDRAISRLTGQIKQVGAP